MGWIDRQQTDSGNAVHQQDLDLNEKILRHFDLSSQYGVCHPAIANSSISCRRHSNWIFHLALHRNRSTQTLATGTNAESQPAA